VVGISAAAALGAGAGRAVFISVAAGGNDLAIMPARIHLVSNEDLSRLAWSTWGGRTALATGRDHGNFPSPGHRAYNPVRVVAAGRRMCGRKLVYTTIRLHFTKGVPYAGQPHRTRYRYGCPS